MNQQEQPTQYDEIEDEINLVDLIYPIFKRRKFLLVFCVIMVLLTSVYTITRPKTYEATASILPEAQTGGTGTELKAAFLEQFGIAGIGGSTSTPSEIYEAVLKSRELAKNVLQRYNYFTLKGIKKKNEASIASGFTSKVKVDKSRDDPSIRVSIQGHDPIMTMDLANTYVRELDEFNRNNTLTTAQRLRQYIDQRLKTANEELEQDQSELRRFQEENKAISISKQAEATLLVLSEMEAQRVELEVTKAAKEKFYRGPHIEIEQLNAQMGALQKNIDRLTYSREDKVSVESEKGKVDFYIPLQRIPALNFDESRLLLKVKAKTGVVTMLTTQLEQAKLDETKDMPTINILDWARPPQKPIKPKLKLNIILAFVVSVFLGIFIIFLWEFLNRIDQDPETAPKWREMKGGIIRPFSFLRRKNRK